MTQKETTECIQAGQNHSTNSKNGHPLKQKYKLVNMLVLFVKIGILATHSSDLPIESRYVTPTVSHYYPKYETNEAMNIK